MTAEVKEPAITASQADPSEALEIKPVQTGNASVTGLKFQKRSTVETNNSNLAVIIFVSLLQVFDLKAGKCIKSIFFNVTEEDPEEVLSSEFLVLDACFSDDGTKFAVILDNKIMRVFNTADWSVIFERSLIKRATTITFSHSGSDVCIADKFGDAYRFPLEKATHDIEAIIGHVSVLTDLTLSPDDKYILTADRDEKVRVSCYPNGYNIHTFCLGHREFVSSLCIPFDKEPLLISGGGDSYLLVSDYLAGKLIEKIDLLSPLELDPSTPRITVADIIAAPVADSESSSWIVVLVESIPKILLFKAYPKHLEFHQYLELESAPSCIGFSSSSSLYVAVNIESAASLVYFKFDDNKAIFVRDQSIDPLVQHVSSSKFIAPSNLKIPLKGDVRKLRPGAPGSHRLGINVEEEQDDDFPLEQDEVSKKPRID